MKTKIKICGITNVEDALLAESLGADFIGLIFAKNSPRYIALDKAKAIIEKLTTAKSIGVFVEQNKQATKYIANICNLWGVQHYTYFEDGYNSHKYIYVLPMNEKSTQKISYYTACDYLLLDTYDENMHGGTGRVFDWSNIPPNRENIFLAGGLRPENICLAIRENTFCLDLSSGVEAEPRKKDPEKLKLLFENLRKIKG